MREKKCFDVIRSLECDVLVVGGGTTGIAAAIASARNGANTILAERNGFVGGNASMIYAWLGFFARTGEQLVKGIAWKLADKIRAKESFLADYPDHFCSSITTVNSNWLKVISIEELEKAGVQTLLHLSLVDIEQEGNRITGAYLFSGEGLLKINCKRIVDCTDTGLIAALSGEEMINGRKEDGQHQVSSWVFEISNIDFDQVFQYFEQNPEDIRPFSLTNPRQHLQDIKERDAFVMGAFSKLVAKAESEGMQLPRKNVPGQVFPRLGKFITMASRVENVNPSNCAEYSQAECAGAKQVDLWMEFLRKYVPGFQCCQLSGSSTSIGIRETNHMVGQYSLTAADLLAGRIFEDTIALGDYHLDIHSPDHKGIDSQLPKIYGIPYRTLLPRKAENLIVAGRAVSADHEAQSSIRVIPISMAMGEAAGTAAAISIHDDCNVAEVNTEKLRKKLVDSGAIINI